MNNSYEYDPEIPPEYNLLLLTEDYDGLLFLLHNEYAAHAKDMLLPDRLRYRFRLAGIAVWIRLLKGVQMLQRMRDRNA